MSERVTRSQVYGAFRQLCKDMSIKCRDDIPEPDRHTPKAAGSWYLEYFTREGYVIHQVVYEDGVEDRHLPFGMQCRPAREMFDTMRFVAQFFIVIDLKKRAERELAAVEDAVRKLRAKEGEVRPKLPRFWRHSK